jgi:hypothetical protein
MEGIMGVYEALDRGLYVDNLYQMARECLRLADNAEKPLVYYVLGHVLGDIAYDWDERPLPAVEVEEMERKVCDPLRFVMNAIQQERGPAQLHECLNDLVRAFLLARRDRGPDPAEL